MWESGCGEERFKDRSRGPCSTPQIFRKMLRAFRAASSLVLELILESVQMVGGIRPNSLCNHTDDQGHGKSRNLQRQ